MSERSEPTTHTDPVAVDQAEYTDEYFLSAVEGHEEFRTSGGRALTPRLRRALRLARPRPGMRLLDIACGRGEIVSNSARLGAHAIGIDYAQAALGLAQRSLNSDTARAGLVRPGLVRMDATSLAFRAETFDVALMLDFVEHVHQPQLERAFQQLQHALKPGGRLIIHTSPNRRFEEITYRHYVRNVHRLVLRIARLLGLQGRLLNKLVLPTDPLPPHNEYERRLHVNPQSSASLRAALERHGFRIERIDFWEPPHGPFFDPKRRWDNVLLQLLDIVRFLRPFSRFPPLNRWFSNHIWVVAQRR